MADITVKAVCNKVLDTVNVSRDSTGEIVAEIDRSKLNAARTVEQNKCEQALTPLSVAGKSTVGEFHKAYYVEGSAYANYRNSLFETYKREATAPLAKRTVEGECKRSAEKFHRGDEAKRVAAEKSCIEIQKIFPEDQQCVNMDSFYKHPNGTPHAEAVVDANIDACNLFYFNADLEKVGKGSTAPLLGAEVNLNPSYVKGAETPDPNDPNATVDNEFAFSADLSAVSTIPFYSEDGGYVKGKLGLLVFVATNDGFGGATAAQEEGSFPPTSGAVFVPLDTGVDFGVNLTPSRSIKESPAVLGAFAGPAVGRRMGVIDPKFDKGNDVGLDAGVMGLHLLDTTGGSRAPGLKLYGNFAIPIGDEEASAIKINPQFLLTTGVSNMAIGGDFLESGGIFVGGGLSTAFLIEKLVNISIYPYAGGIVHDAEAVKPTHAASLAVQGDIYGISGGASFDLGKGQVIQSNVAWNMGSTIADAYDEEENVSVKDFSTLLIQLGWFGDFGNNVKVGAMVSFKSALATYVEAAAITGDPNQSSEIINHGDVTDRGEATLAFQPGLGWLQIKPYVYFDGTKPGSALFDEFNNLGIAAGVDFYLFGNLVD